MTQYELCVICQKEEDKKIIEKILADAGVKIKYTQNIGRKKLVYPIKKENSANYFSFYFDLDASKVSLLHKTLQDEQSLLRFIIVKNEIEIKKIEAQSKLSQKPQQKKKTLVLQKPVITAKVETKKIAIPKVKTKKTFKIVKPKEKIKSAEILEENIEKNAKADETERIKKLEEKLDELLKE